MICKGIIKSIDFNSNTCSVRIPTFESAGGGDEAIADAIFAITPGTANGYQVDDIVFVAFENNQLRAPVVIGKLYLNENKNKLAACGAITCKTLTATEACEIPLNTKLSSGDDSTKVGIEGDNNSYKTLRDIVQKLQDLSQPGSADSAHPTYYMHYVSILDINWNAVYVKIISSKKDPFTSEQELSDVMACNVYKGNNKYSNFIIAAHWEYDTGIGYRWGYSDGKDAWDVYLSYNSQTQKWFIDYYMHYTDSNSIMHRQHINEEVMQIDDFVQPI